jgi:hypothetical protein
MPYARIAEGVTPPRFQTGAHVRFRLGSEFVRGKITEYRGPLAAGRHVYRVEVPFYGNYVQAYELPEEELKRA